MKMFFARLLYAAAALLMLVPSTASAQTPRPTCNLSASQGSVLVGETVNLKWASENSTSGTISGIGSVGASGIQGVIPVAPATTYVAKFNGPGGSTSCSITISVTPGNGFGGVSPSGSGGSFNNTTGGSVSNTSGGSSFKGLVPCTGRDCQLCSLASLGQRIINFLVGISIPLATAMFAYAGIILFTNAAMDKRKQAKGIFVSVFIGFVIVLSGWLGIQTILSTVLAPGYYQSWNTIQCVGESQRPLNKTVQDLINLLPGLSTAVQPSAPFNYGGGVNYQCDRGTLVNGACWTDEGTYVGDPRVVNTSNGSNYSCQDGSAVAGNRCVTVEGQDIGPAMPSAPMALSRGDCSAANIMAAAAENDDGVVLNQREANVLSCLTGPESGCNNNAAPPTNGCIPGRTCSSARGVLQVVRGYSDDNHSLNFQSCGDAARAAGYGDVVNSDGGLNCSPAFRGGVNNGSRLAKACDAAASNFTCNVQAAAGLVADKYQNNPNQSGASLFSDWTADSRSSRQTQCIQQYY